MWLWILIGLGIITKVHGFSNGDFPDVCESMLPNHERRGATILPQSGDPPFYIEFGEVINGTNLTGKETIGYLFLKACLSLSISEEN